MWDQRWRGQLELKLTTPASPSPLSSLSAARRPDRDVPSVVRHVEVPVLLQRRHAELWIVPVLCEDLFVGVSVGRELEVLGRESDLGRHPGLGLHGLGGGSLEPVIS